MKLDDIRIEINKIDKEMAELFEKRMLLCKDVAIYKKNNSIPILDAGREQTVIDNNLKNINNDDIKEHYVTFINNVMDISKLYQEQNLIGLKIAYSGVVGAYGNIAAKKMFSNCEFIPMKSFKEAYASVENGENDRVVLPIENSFAGDVGEVMDLIFFGNLYINSVYNLNVEHCLVVNKGTKFEDIKCVISHPQALMQCNKFIMEHGFESQEEANTALAAKRLKEIGSLTKAVIASKETAVDYDLDILKEKINDAEINLTRFASLSRVLSSQNSIGESKKNFIIVFTVKNVAGALAKCLDIIGAHGFNLRNLRSRPLKDSMWSYYFFCEIEGDYESVEAQDMFVALKVFCDRLKIVGNYTS